MFNSIISSTIFTIYTIFISMSFTLHSVATTSQLQYETSTPYGIQLPTQSDIPSIIYNHNLKYRGLQHRNLQETSSDKFAKSVHG